MAGSPGTAACAYAQRQRSITARIEAHDSAFENISKQLGASRLAFCFVAYVKNDFVVNLVPDCHVLHKDVSVTKSMVYLIDIFIA